MKKAFVIKDRCDSSIFCAASRSCPKGAIKRIRKGLFNVEISVDEDLCAGCGICVNYCPHGAIEMKKL